MAAGPARRRRNSFWWAGLFVFVLASASLYLLGPLPISSAQVRGEGSVDSPSAGENLLSDPPATLDRSFGRVFGELQKTVRERRASFRSRLETLPIDMEGFKAGLRRLEVLPAAAGGDVESALLEEISRGRLAAGIDFLFFVPSDNRRRILVSGGRRARRGERSEPSGSGDRRPEHRLEVSPGCAASSRRSHGGARR